MNRTFGLVLKGFGAAIPELGNMEGAVKDGERVDLASGTIDANGDRKAIRSGLIKGVTRGAGNGVVCR